MSFRSKLNKAKLLLMKHGPRIATWTGVGLMGAGTVVACKQTRKLDEVLKPYQEEIEKIPEGPNQAMDIFKVKCRAAGKVAKLYALPAAMSLGGAASIVLGEDKVEKRFAGAMVFGNGLLATIKDYRERVSSLVGKEDEQKLWDGYKAETVKTQLVNEKGEEVESFEKRMVIPANYAGPHSPYARYFDEASQYYSDSCEYNIAFLKGLVNELNRDLRKRGYIGLNEVYHKLGLCQTQEGCFVGWLWSDDGSTNNYISFGLEKYAGKNLATEDPHILLDFNIDGFVYDKINSVKKLAVKGRK